MLEGDLGASYFCKFYSRRTAMILRWRLRKNPLLLAQERGKQPVWGKAWIKHFVLFNKASLHKKTILSEPNQLGIYQILTDLREGQYPTPALSSLTVSPQVGRMGLRSTHPLAEAHGKADNRIIICFPFPNITTTSTELQYNNRTQPKSCTFQSLFKKTSIEKPKYTRETKTST